MGPVNSRSTTRKPYQSRLRAQQAAATRQLVLDAATRLFIEHGYAATSIDAIADAAGVGRSTVFAAAGGKPWLLKTAYDRAIVGDDEPVPLRERPQVRRLFELTDPARIVDGYTRILAEGAQRVSAIYQVVASAAGCDPEVHQLWVTLSDERFVGAGQIADLIAKRGGLRRGLSRSAARDIVWVYNDPGLHHALVVSRGWALKRYRDWIADSLRHNLLG
ncbi:TetR/AcrR family transcriptional regulator [Mycobacterium heidelbergense]|uniref:DNA-binding protein n=1 Tax=Mycobacterium heidelbergense TaxID=53376 RepID=A0A1X0DM12_MYCHE|nr:TetR family transcriptional regulator [Mycobacterium heidelbergense]ORA73189.1 DNA-binding protein [Mycobacterium heidelbergense]BBZ52079.1 DNA-binding protein [Mycobacterium heidelbergense]